MGHFKWNSALEHAQNTGIHIILHRHSLLWAFALHWKLYTLKWFCLLTVKTLITLCRCTGWYGSLLSTYTQRHVFAGGSPNILLIELYTGRMCVFGHCTKWAVSLHHHVTQWGVLLYVSICYNIQWIWKRQQKPWSDYYVHLYPRKYLLHISSEHAYNFWHLFLPDLPLNPPFYFTIQIMN